MGCPDDNVLVAMVEQALEPAHFAELEVHIDSCEHCRKIVAAAVASKTLAVGTPQPAEEDALASLVDVSISGRYIIEAVLGRGGMGTVYLARDQSLGRDVALKVHRAGSGNDRLHREAIAMAKLAHPNVVNVFEVGSVDDRMYVAMEYVRGETLRGWLATGKRTWREIIDMLVLAGAGLAAAHTAGLIHRDFKPENVLVGEDGRPRVSDFGLARVGAGRDVKPTDLVMTDMTQTGAILGTPAYMAPEQLAGDTVDARCDQFAFCVVAWEALFGKRPFAGNTLAALEDAIHRQEIQRPPRAADVPQRVRDVIERGLAVKADDRYADMPALLAALRTVSAPRTKRYLAVGLATAVFLGAGGYAAISFVEARRQAAACDAEAASVRGVLGVTNRFDVERAFFATGSPYAATAFDRTMKVLDQYSGKLADQVHGVCRGLDEPVSMSVARKSCLDERKRELTSFAARLAHADALLVQRAPSSAWAMFDPAPCTDPSMLLSRPLSQAPREAELTARLEEAKALVDRGKYADAATIARKLADEAHARNDKALELVSLHQLATALANSNTPDAAAPIYQQCAKLAEATGRDLDAAGSLWALANLYGVELQQHQLAHQYIDLARAKLDRVGSGNLGVRGELLVTEAQVYLDENRLGESEKLMRQAAATLEQAYGPDHPKVASALGSLSQVLRGLGKDSLPESKRCYEIFERAYGPDHPTTAGAEMNLAQALMDANHLDDARVHLVRADRVFATLYGEFHPLRAAIAGNLAGLEQLQSHWPAAEAADRRAIAILEKLQGPDSADVSGARRDLARVLALAGKLPDAIAEMHKAITPLEKMGSDGEGRLVSAYSDIAEYELYAGKAADALPNAEKALALAQKQPVDANPGELADAKFVLARALWETKGDRARARKLVDEANPLIKDDAKRVELETWLREHPAATLR